MSARKALTAGNDVPTRLLKGLEEHKSGATNKLSGHNMAGTIQTWKLLLTVRGQKATRSTANVTAAPMSSQS